MTSFIGLGKLLKPEPKSTSLKFSSIKMYGFRECRHLPRNLRSTMKEVIRKQWVVGLALNANQNKQIHTKFQMMRSVELTKNMHTLSSVSFLLV